MVTVLLADSQPLFNEALEALSSRDDVHQVIGRCSSAEDAFTHVSGRCPDLVLIDAVLGLEGSPAPGHPRAAGLPAGVGDRARAHVRNLLEKLGVHSKLEAATFALQRSLELELTSSESA